MRKKVFFALGCVLYLTGCDSSSLEKVIPQTKFFPIQFSIQMEKEIVSFPTRSIPNNVIPEPTASKAGESDAELNEICSTIEYVVFKNEDTPALIKHKQFTYNPTDLDADFSCIYATRRLQILLFSPQFKKRCIIRFNFFFRQHLGYILRNDIPKHRCCRNHQQRCLSSTYRQPY